MDVDVSIRIGGEAGQGMQSIGFAIGKVFTRHGYYTFINQDVESRIRGGGIILFRSESGTSLSMPSKMSLISCLPSINRRSPMICPI